MAEKTTLWKLLSANKVVIPIIQRDYAQGREGKENLRIKFLGDIKYALNDSVTNLNEELNLDFVFGSIKDNTNVYLPLDGQQRITTLWLVHWYFAFMSGKLILDSNSSYVSDLLSNFYYETRNSSTEFCEALCKKTCKKDFDKFRGKSDKSTIVDYIQSRTWFFSDWKLDPTINSMLRMISGSAGNLSGDDAKTINDNIEAVFGNVNHGLYFQLIKKTITFNKLEIGSKKLPLPDDQYIKMNSRGEALTGFENFKSNLLAWMKNNVTQKVAFDPKKIAGNIDSVWTDVIWREKRKKPDFDHKIDEELFLFICKFIMVKICLTQMYGDRNFKASVDKLTKDDPAELCAFTKLYDSNVDINKELFKDVFEPVLSLDILNDLDNIFTKLHNENFYNKICDVINSFKPVSESGWLLPNKKTIKTDEEELETIETAQKEYIYFYCITQCVLKMDLDDQVELKRFFRVVRNVVENAQIESVPNMISCIRQINVLVSEMTEAKQDDTKQYDILSILNDKNYDDSSALLRQLKEESEKAKAIINGYVEEKDIVEAENMAFFEGTIRFLYRGKYNDNNEFVAEPDWKNSFSKKKENIEKLLDADNINVTPEAIVKLLDQYSAFNNLVKNHRKKRNGSYETEPFYFSRRGDDNRKWSWKRSILWGDWCDAGCKNEILEPIHRILMDLPNKSFNKDEEYDAFINAENIDHKKLVEVISSPDNKNDYYLWNHSDKEMAVRVEGNGSDYIAIRRGADDYKKTIESNKKLSDLIDKKIIVSEIVTDKSVYGGFIWGKKILFTLASETDKKYGWDTNGMVYLQGKNNVNNYSEKYDDLDAFIQAKNLDVNG